MLRIGIFSGTFDPIHDGHILFAQIALNQFDLDQVLFAPEAKPRYKEFSTDSTYRAAMIERAISEYDQFNLFVSAYDQHGLEILNEIEETNGPVDFFMLIGSDIIDYLSDWKDIDEITSRVTFVIGSRENDADELVDEKAKIAQIKYEILPSPAKNISSSRIRQSIAEHLEPIGLNDNVKKFIEQHQLYG